MAGNFQETIPVQHLFRALDQKLIQLLQSLQPTDWQRPTIAGKWTVKDVVAHLLDGNIRALSIQRDRYFGEKAPQKPDYQALVSWLNALNADWVKAMQRVSPNVLVLLHEWTGPLTCDYFESLDPAKQAVFPIDWAGESESLNWMHLAREYTEKWHHQQQIRDALAKQGIMGDEFFSPFIATYMKGMPNQLKSHNAKPGTIIQITITGQVSYDFYFMKTASHWEEIDDPMSHYNTLISIPRDIAWKLFSKNIRPGSVRARISISGDIPLGEKAIEMVSVMA